MLGLGTAAESIKSFDRIVRILSGVESRSVDPVGKGGNRFASSLKLVPPTFNLKYK